MASDKENKNEKAEAENSSEAGREGKERAWWSEAVKEVTLTGLATFFMTEESVRNYLKEKKLPKELVGLVLDSITKKKDDFYGLLANEFGRVLSKIDITKEVSKFMETHDLTVKVSFRKKKDGGEDV